jgi:hypothetical protein
VHRTGGLDFETVNYYRVGIVATSNGSTINCTLDVDVNDVNEKPIIQLGTPPRRNVSEAALANEYLTGGAIRVSQMITTFSKRHDHTCLTVSNFVFEGR